MGTGDTGTSDLGSTSSHEDRTEEPDGVAGDPAPTAGGQRKGCRTFFVSVAAVVLAITALWVAVWGIGVVRENQAEDRARTADPVGTTSFQEVIDRPSRYDGEVWRLEGVIPELRHRNDSDRWSSTVFSECADGCEADDDSFRYLVLVFIEGPPADFAAGDRVRVTCRVVGLVEPGAFTPRIPGEVSIRADLCRDWAPPGSQG